LGRSGGQDDRGNKVTTLDNSFTRTPETDAALLAAIAKLWPNGAGFSVDDIAAHCVCGHLDFAVRLPPFFRCYAPSVVRSGDGDDSRLWEALGFMQPIVGLRKTRYDLLDKSRDRLDAWLNAIAGHAIGGFRLERDHCGQCRVVKSGVTREARR